MEKVYPIGLLCKILIGSFQPKIDIEKINPDFDKCMVNPYI